MSRGDRKRAPSATWKRMQELITDDARYTVNLSADIADQVNLYLKEKNWTQKDLADALGKSPSEVSKWLQLGHNFTCRTIGKLSAALGKDIVATPLRYNSMNGQFLPFGEERSRAYVVARDPQSSAPISFDHVDSFFTPRFNYDAFFDQSLIFSSEPDGEVSAPTGSPSYAMAA